MAHFFKILIIYKFLDVDNDDEIVDCIQSLYYNRYFIFNQLKLEFDKLNKVDKCY